MKDIRQKVVLITGGGQGLGAAITNTLADAGAVVIPVDIKIDSVKKVAEEINARNGKAEAMNLDVSNAEDVKKTIDVIVEKYGRLDIVINNAGIDYTKSVADLSVEEFERVVKVNLVGPFLTSKFALAHMAKQKSGHIVNICSTAALRAWPEASAYHASKWGLRGFSHALFTEAKKEQVKVTAVIAGGMKTPFILERFPEAEPNLQDPQNVADTVKYVLSMEDESVIPEVMVIPLKETSWP
jgi:NAD(P)-dependent dehydrogenase (short-subunit alcohol dehydrogenase family)